MRIAPFEDLSADRRAHAEAVRVAGADGAALGATSYRDFELLAGLVATLDGGVVLNVGSAVILPEVFLKALSMARNLGYDVRRFTSINLDFLRQYRPTVNVIGRPTRQVGRGISLVGHHEILVPLLAAGFIERAGGRRAGKGAKRGARGRARNAKKKGARAGRKGRPS